jgi:hypothetical protein
MLGADFAIGDHAPAVRTKPDRSTLTRHGAGSKVCIWLPIGSRMRPGCAGLCAARRDGERRSGPRTQALGEEVRSR